jgi:nucleoid-associated protein YgaU
VPYGTMAFLENTILPQASLLASAVTASIYDALALEVKVVFSPAPELVEKAKARAAMVTLGDPTVGSLHIVAPGDSLSKIARQRYSDMMIWPLIYDANRATVGPNPNLIRPGQRLMIPRLASFTAAQIDEARRRAPAWR